LRLSTSAVKVWFFETLRQYYPHLVQPYAELYQRSAYAPVRYREPIKKAIQALLERHHVLTREPLQAINAKTPPKEEPFEPVQLTFSFE
jgi:hypothetical protein